MATLKGSAEAVKAGLKDGTASAVTINSLQSLLDLGPSQAALSVRPAQTTTKTSANALQNSKGTTRRKANPAPTATIPEDAVSQLSAREKYALATETVNAALKTLSESLKSPSNATTKATPSPNKAAPEMLSQRALQARSVNITPSKTNANVQKPPARLSSRSSIVKTRDVESNIAATAECAHLAFSFLRSADPSKFGGREMPALQLENGMLALAGRMAAHGLESMAVTELRIVKRRLEASFPRPKPTKTKPAPSAMSQVATEKETMASLMNLDVDLHTNSEATAVAITYYFHVLKIISTLRKPAVIEGVLQYLQIDAPNSVVDLLLRQIEHSKDNTKWLKQLESLSQTLLGLCPSISTSADEIAKDSKLSPSPQVAFELQVLALKIRRLWWRTSNHDADFSKELIEPLQKCATAFVRRTSARDATATYHVLDQCVGSLGPFDSDIARDSLFGIHCLLRSQAIAANLQKDVKKWADEMIRDCVHLEDNHVRRVICAVDRSTSTLGRKLSAGDNRDVDNLSDLLCKKLTGNSADYDLLISALAQLARSLCGTKWNVATVRLSGTIAGFALRYSRLYPGKNTSLIQSVLDTALRMSRSIDDMLSWVTEGAAKFFVNEGALKNVALAAATMPSASAWRGSAPVESLERVLRMLLIRVVRRSGAVSISIFDMEDLGKTERGAMLEVQLRYAVELAGKSKYFYALQKILPELLNRLEKLYTVDGYPIRRARVACLVFRLRECNAGLLSDDHFKPWRDTELNSETQLGEDFGLGGLLEDVRATLEVARAFSDGRPSVKDLKPSLLRWQRIIDGLCDRNHAHRCIEDPESLIRQLSSVVAYLNALGEGGACLAVQLLILKLNRVVEDRDSQLCFTTTDLARQYLQLGYSSRAEIILEQVRAALDQQQTSPLVNMDFQVAYAEYFLAIDKLDECQSALEESRIYRGRLPPQAVPSEERRRYELLHAQAWVVQSGILLESGYPHESLSAAKQSVRLLSGIWASLERSNSNPKADTVPNVDDVSAQDSKERTGVSKLQLTPIENDQPAKTNEQSTKGAAFWPLVRPLCKAFLQLSDVYAHHGLFNESSYYSERAVGIAESIGVNGLLLQVRSHRSQLLTLADRVEEAELCITQGISPQSNEASHALVQYNCAQAAIREREDALEEAAALYQKAEEMLDGLGTEDCLQKLECVDSDDGNLESRMASLSISSTDKVLSGKLACGEHRVAPAGKLKAPIKKNGTRAVRSGREPKCVADQGSDPRIVEKFDYVIRKWRANIVSRKALLDIKRGRDVQSMLDELQGSIASTAVTVQNRLLVHNELLRKAMSALQMDVTLNVLPESTLSFPAIRHDDKARSSNAAKTSRAEKKVTTKVTRKKETSEVRFADLIYAAKESLLHDRWRSDLLYGTIQSHVESSQLLNATLLLSSISGLESKRKERILDQTLAIDLPRIKASQYEQGAMTMDEPSSNPADFLAWPCHDGSPKTASVVTAEDFQETYIDILPRSWTAVSLSLNEDGTEFYAARYRSNQLPFILRLPFSRTKSDELSEDAFDYHRGKAELQDIIEQSNYSCHNPGDLDVKGTKTKWWNQRKALDRRLEELLINVESIWFGGFKSIFAQDRIDSELFIAFRASFEEILKRHLPSRRAAKERSGEISLHDHILELFIGLGDDQDGAADLDEPLADLLYFVVDMLQFNGERNAYDEIDFDNMAVDVLDALRVYHAACANVTEDSEHLILVLDRRLQAFPWESLPCLEEANVSRVGSLLSLRQKIMAQRSSQSRIPADGIEHKPIVKRTAGTYILNPGSDLCGTQTTLDPVLSKLCASGSGNWTSITNVEPKEAELSSALENSSMLLYFGHGAGSQYIRPRTIKKLEQCCDVIWLMGCSSGSVNEYGAFEPCAIPLCYLLAGEGSEPKNDNALGTCKAVVATLWDVTDKDIDRFSIALGEEWGLWSEQERPPLPTKTPRKRELLAATPSTPQQMPKTPKTPKIVKTPAAFKTPIRDRLRPGKATGAKQSLVEAVARSRSTCNLRYLNGAAPVVYGIPVYLGD